MDLKRVAHRVGSHYMLRIADSRGNMVRTLGLSKKEADLFHRVGGKLSFALASWWKESKYKTLHKFLDSPFARWVTDNIGVSGNWRKWSYEKALSKYEEVALRDPTEQGSLLFVVKGWKWVKYSHDAFGESRCPIWVRDFLGHCGEASGDMVILFDPRNKPRITTTVKGKSLVDIVGPGHSDLKDKYKPFIKSLAERYNLKISWPSKDTRRLIEEWTQEEKTLNYQRDLVHNSSRDKMEKPLKITQGLYKGSKAFIMSDFKSDDTVDVLVADIDDNIMQAFTKSVQINISILDLASP